MSQILQVKVNHVPQSEYNKVNALAKQTASLTFPSERDIQITIGKCHLLASSLYHFDETKEVNMVLVFVVKEEKNWREPLIDYMKYGILPTDPKKRAGIKQ